MPYGPHEPVVENDVGAQRRKPLTAKERRNATVQQRKADAKDGSKKKKVYVVPQRRGEKRIAPPNPMFDDLPKNAFDDPPKKKTQPEETQPEETAGETFEMEVHATAEPLDRKVSGHRPLLAV